MENFLLQRAAGFFLSFLPSLFLPFSLSNKMTTFLASQICQCTHFIDLNYGWIKLICTKWMCLVHSRDLTKETSTLFKSLHLELLNKKKNTRRGGAIINKAKYMPNRWFFIHFSSCNLSSWLIHIQVVEMHCHALQHL